MITIILIGTIHETKREEVIFKTLDRYMASGKYKHLYWLCEGEQYGRQCVSLKDNNVHLLTDALFVNMMLLDLVNMKDNLEYQTSLDERIMELAVTIKKSQFKDQLMRFAKQCDSMRLFIKYIIDLLLDNGTINKSYEECIYNFYNNGHTCEDEIMTVMREKSFVKIILMFIVNLLKEKHNRVRLVITVGVDHISMLKGVLNNITNNIIVIDK